MPTLGAPLAPGAEVSATARGVSFFDDGVAAQTPTPSSTRAMAPGACVLCACVSARRWYFIDEEPPPAGAMENGGDAGAGTGPGDPTYLAGKGTTRERRLPLVLAPRSRWSGAGAAAAPGTAALCPHCHVQNEQLWVESMSSGGGGGGGRGARDVKSTLSQFDRIMSILGPRRQGGSDKAVPARPRRRAGKNGVSGYFIPPGGDAPGADGAHGEAPSRDGSGGGGTGLSRSAPAASSLHSAMGGLNLGYGARTTAREDAALREELAEVSRLGHRRRRRWVREEYFSRLRRSCENRFLSLKTPCKMHVYSSHDRTADVKQKYPAVGRVVESTEDEELNQIK